MDRIITVMLWARKYIQASIKFLATIARYPEKENWHKFRQVLQYIWCKIYMPLIIRANGLNMIKW